MRLFVFGMSHRSAPVSLRESFAVAPDEMPDVLRALVGEPGISEAMLLSTCNRVEAYVVPDEEGQAREALTRVLGTRRGLDLRAVEAATYASSGREAVHHLLRVASSLDSMVVGEPQILGQVKEAAHAARSAGTVGPLLGRLLDRTFATAKSVRTRTGIGEHVVSIGSVAVDLARRIFKDLEDSRVLLVGAGKMGEATARSLKSAGAERVYVANRSYERAVKLAEKHGWRARALTELEELFAEVDIVITSTGATRPIVDAALVRRVIPRRKYRPLFIVDIAVPRDVAPEVGDIDTIYLYNVDDLEGVSRDAMMRREKEAAAAEALVRDELETLERWYTELAVQPTLAAIRQRAQGLAHAEVERTLSKRLAHLTEADRDAVTRMTEALVAKLLHPTMTALRSHASDAAATELLAIARLLHGVDEDHREEDA
ncbi:MAG: glutamyl-tRNA reductase [Deltaproteobacteria bacterium]|nr:glutamyl-tRNA reductase [Deltaproteobacteria bacterium]MCB9788189.1 glutamyl-tRNA reductase [Deltaproteobacteria bacterium]